MRFTERWYRFIVRVFPAGDSGSCRDEVLTTLRDTGRMGARFPSVRESVLLAKSGYMVRAESSPEPLRTALLPGLAFGAVLFLGFVWVRQIEALRSGFSWGYAPSFTDWIVVAIPVFIILAAAPNRTVRMFSVVILAVLLVAVPDRSASDILRFEDRHWLLIDLFRLVRIAVPMSVIALAAPAVTTVAGPTVSFLVGASIGLLSNTPSGLLVPIGGEYLLLWGTILAAVALVTPIPLVAVMSAGTFVELGNAVRGYRSLSDIMMIAIPWIVTIVVILATRSARQRLGGLRRLGTSRPG
jgi:hypothetical protein